MVTLLNTNKFQVLVTLMFVLFSLSIFSTEGFAQNQLHRSLEVKSTPKGYRYLSYDMLLGTRSFTVHSPMNEIDQLSISKAGGSFGVMYGNEVIKGHARMGLFFTGIKELRTVEMMDTDLGVNVSLLSMFNEKARNFDVYLTGGYSTQLHTFRGSYVKSEPQLVSNNPNLEPLVGRILSHNLNYGAGVSYTLRSDYRFFTFMAEYKTTGVVQAKNSGYLQTTRIADVNAFNIGFRAGALKAKRK